MAHCFREVKMFLGVLIAVLLMAAQPASADRRVYTVGIVPQFEASRLHGIWRPILDRLESETGLQFVIRGSSTISQFEIEFAAGQFDFAYMNPYHLVIANDSAGYLPIVYDGGRELSGVLVASRSSGITSPEQLDGKVIAFPAPNALGASLMMRQELTDTFKISFTPRYVKTHDSVYINVLVGEAQAGGGVQATLRRQKQQYQDNLVVIHKTQSVPPHPLAALPSVPQDIQEQVRTALLKMGETDQGRELLSKVPISAIAPADLSLYIPLKNLGLDRFYQKP